MKVTIRTLLGSSSDILASDSWTVEELQDLVSFGHGINLEQTTLLHHDEELLDDQNLTDYGIQDVSVILLVVKLHHQDRVRPSL